jgi:hypothetical protein
MPYFHVFQKKRHAWKPIEGDLSGDLARSRIAAGANCVLRTGQPFEAAWERYCTEAAGHTDAGDLTFGVPPMHSQLPQVSDSVTTI